MFWWLNDSSPHFGLPLFGLHPVIHNNCQTGQEIRRPGRRFMALDFLYSNSYLLIFIPAHIDIYCMYVCTYMHCIYVHICIYIYIHSVIYIYTVCIYKYAWMHLYNCAILCKLVRISHLDEIR